MTNEQHAHLAALLLEAQGRHEAASLYRPTDAEVIEGRVQKHDEDMRRSSTKRAASRDVPTVRRTPARRHRGFSIPLPSEVD